MTTDLLTFHAKRDDGMTLPVFKSKVMGLLNEIALLYKTSQVEQDASDDNVINRWVQNIFEDGYSIEALRFGWIRYRNESPNSQFPPNLQELIQYITPSADEARVLLTKFLRVKNQDLIHTLSPREYYVYLRCYGSLNNSDKEIIDRLRRLMRQALCCAECKLPVVPKPLPANRAIRAAADIADEVRRAQVARAVEQAEEFIRLTPSPLAGFAQQILHNPESGLTQPRYQLVLDYLHCTGQIENDQDRPEQPQTAKILSLHGPKI